jgi:hypothetical protein
VAGCGWRGGVAEVARGRARGSESEKGEPSTLICIKLVTSKASTPVIASYCMRIDGKK